jgi:hypothetical protein
VVDVAHVAPRLELGRQPVVERLTDLALGPRLGVGQHRGQHPDDRPERLPGGPAGRLDGGPGAAELLAERVLLDRDGGRPVHDRVAAGHDVGGAPEAEDPQQRPVVMEGGVDDRRGEVGDPGGERDAGVAGRGVLHPDDAGGVEQPPAGQALVQVVGGDPVRDHLLGGQLLPW